MASLSLRRWVATAVALPLGAAACAAVVLPVNNDFEIADGYSLGPATAGNGWNFSVSLSTQIADHAFSGDQGLSLTGEGWLTFAAEGWAPGFDSSVTWVDFYLKPAFADITLLPAEVNEAVAAVTGFVKLDATLGEVYAVNGDGLGGGDWLASGHTTALLNEQAVNWVRISYRMDYGTKRWDLFLDGNLVMADLGFADSAASPFAQFRIKGDAEKAAFLDYFYVGSDNPLFTDTSSDGLPDSWLSAHGLNPAVYQRYGDIDHDGVDNLTEFQLGLLPNSPDTDNDGVFERRELLWNANPNVADAYTLGNVPFSDGFEADALGAFATGTRLWQVQAGEGATVAVSNAQGNPEGIHALNLTGADISLERRFADTTHAPVVWLDFHVMPTPQAEPPADIPADVAAVFYFASNETLVALNGSGAGGGEWTSLSAVPAGWHRVSLRMDYLSQRWSLWFDGIRRGANLGFAYPVPFFSGFALQHSASQVGRFDGFQVRHDEPADLDNDGDGLSNADETILGSNAESSDSDGDGLFDGVEVGFGSDPLTTDAILAHLQDDGQGSFVWRAHFSAPEGYAPGSLDGQLGWRAAGSTVTNEETALLQASSESSPANLEHLFGLPGFSQPWISFRARMVPGTLPDAVTLTGPISCLFGYTAENTLAIYDSSVGQWTSHAVSANASGWNRYDLKLDYTAHTWLLRINGMVVAENLPFRDTDLSMLTRLRVLQSGMAGGALNAWLDEVIVANADPDNLRLDDDGDGMSNDWEVLYGLNPQVNDSFDDSDSDGVPNRFEYEHGSIPTDSSSLPPAQRRVDQTDSQAYATIQAAIDAADTYEIIEVSPGNYSGVGNRSLNTNGKVVFLRGAGSELVTIDLDANGAGVSTTANLVVSGLTFKEPSGAAIHLQGASAILKDIKVTEAVDFGGALLELISASAIITDLEIRSGLSGGIRATDTELAIENYSFWGNTVAVGQAALQLQAGSEATLADAFFADNHSAGALITQEGEGTTSDWTNAVVLRNESAAGRLWDNGDTVTTITHSTFANNRVPDSPGACVQGEGGSVVVRNSIFYNDALADEFQGSSSFALSHVISGSVESGTQVLNVDPQLTQSGHVKSTSPAIDAGIGGTGVAQDVDLEARPHNDIPDIGADEWIPDTNLPRLPAWFVAQYSVTSLGANQDGDALIDYFEYLAGTSPTATDSDGDGVADALAGPPAVYAGEDLSVISGMAAQLAGFVYDDGLPNPPGQIQVEWLAFDAAGAPVGAAVELEDRTNPQTLVRFTQTGRFTLRLTATDDLLTDVVYDEIVVDVVGLESGYGDLVGQWLFEEGGGSHAGDASGNGNIAALSGDSGWTEGVAGQGLSIGSGHGMAEVSNSAGLNIEGEITLAAWVQFSESTANRFQRILSTKYAWNSIGGYELEYNAAERRLTFCGYGTQQFIAFDVDLTDGWHHVAFVLKKNTLRPFTYDGAFYVDGQLLVDYPFSIPGYPFVTRRIKAYQDFPQQLLSPEGRMHLIRDGGANFAIGSHPSGSTVSEDFKGSLDDVRVYRTALDEAAVQAVFKDRNGLKFWVKASDAQVSPDETAVNVWPDLSGHGNDLLPASDETRPALAITPGQPATVVFDGVDDALSATFTEGISGSTTYLIVARNLGGRSEIGAGILATASAPSLASFDLTVTESNTLGLNTYDGRSYSVGYWDSSVHVYSIVIEAADSEGDATPKLTLYRDQRLVSVNDIEATEAQLLTTMILGHGREVSSFARVGIAEVQVYNRALGSLERQRIENTLMLEYVETTSRLIELTSPRQETTLTKMPSQPLTVILRARALESGRPLARVEFYADDVLVGTATQAPYECQWNDVPFGIHEIVAVSVESHTLFKSDSLARRIAVVPAAAYQIMRLPKGESATDISDMPTLGSPVYISGYGEEKPLLWKSGSVVPTSLQLTAGMGRGQAVSVNANGVAVGWVVDSTGRQKATLWNVDGSLTFIPIPSASAANLSYATHISDTGYVSGTFQVSAKNLNPFRYTYGSGVMKTDWENSASYDFANYVSDTGILSGAIGWKRPPVPPGWWFAGAALTDPVVTAEPSFESGSTMTTLGPPAYPTFEFSPPFAENTYVQAHQAFLPSLFSSQVNAMSGSTWVGQSGITNQIGHSTYQVYGKNYGVWYWRSTKHAHKRTGSGSWQRLSPYTLGGMQSEALDIAQVAGQGQVIVGWSHTGKDAKPFRINGVPNFIDPGYLNATTEVHAFIQIGSDPMADLNHKLLYWMDVIPGSNPTGWVLVRANAVNNQGWVVGEGYYNGQYAAYVTAPAADTDGDFLSDLHESLLYGGDGSSAYSDADTLSDLQEALTGSNSGLIDSDGDGLPDDWEFNHELNPGLATMIEGASGDPDQDDLTNLQEYQLGTHPWKPDTDADGMPDGWEVSYSLNPLDPADAEQHADGDGLINLLEWQFNSDPTKIDGDVAAAEDEIPHPVSGLINTGDGLTDYEELLLGLDPLVYDTHLASRARTGLNYWQQHTDPGADTDGDGLSDFAEGLWETDPALADTDGDTMPDGWEVAYGFDPLDPADATGDGDNDNLNNLQEYQLGLLPNDFDSDDDGLGDGWEIVHGFSPDTLRADLAGWWRFDGVTADRVVIDSAGILHDGLLCGAAAIQGGGRRGGALRLDGLDSYAMVNNHADLALDTSTTLAFWYRPDTDSLTTTRQLFDKLGSYTLEIEPGGRLLFTWLIDGTAHTAPSTASLVESEWNHIVLTIDRATGEIRFHLNGAADSTHTVALSEPFDASPWPLMFGSQRVLPMSRTPKGLLDDVRLYARVITSAEIVELANPAAVALDPNRDDDSDGLTNAEEAAAGTDPDVADTDGDGLSDSNEVNVHRSNPLLTDTDGDTLSDYAEVQTHGTNPRSQDTDGDGLGDLREVTIWSTSSALTYNNNVVDTREQDPIPDTYPSRPDGWDTDGDGMPDGWEVRYGLDPLIDDSVLDPDVDGMSNLVEYQKDNHPFYPDDISTAIDTDEDGLSDWDEKYRYHTDPNNPATTEGINDLYAATYGLLPGSAPDLPAGTTAGTLVGDTPVSEEAQAGTSPVDDQNKSSVALEIPIREVPTKEIAHDAAEPPPIPVYGNEVTLKFPGCGQKVFLSDTNLGGVGTVVVAIDGLVLTDPSGRVTAKSIKPFNKSSPIPGVRPDHLMGKSAAAAYLPESGYDITSFVQKLTPDTSGYVRFKLKAEVKPVVIRKPAPPEEPEDPEEDPEDPEDPGTDPGTGTGGSGSGSSWSGWGGLWSFGNLWRYGPYHSTTTPSEQDDPDPVKPTYATSRIIAFVYTPEGCGCKTFGDDVSPNGTASLSGLDGGAASSSGVNVSFNLSPTGSAAAEGSLRLGGDDLASLASPAGLAAISGYSKDTQFVMENGAVRQAVSASRVIDVQPLSGGQTGYQLRFFESSAITGTTETNLRTLAAVDPLATWTVENPGDQGGFNVLRLTHVENGRTRVYEYRRGNTASTQSNWEYIEGGGLRITSLVEETDPDGDLYRTTTLSDAIYGVASVTRQRFHEFAWGEEMIEETVDPDGPQPLTTHYDYLTTGDAVGNLGTTTLPDGTTEVRQFTTTTQPNGYVIVRETGSTTTYPDGRQRMVAHSTLPDFANDDDALPEPVVLTEEKEDGAVYRRSWSVTSSGFVTLDGVAFRESRSITGFASSSAWDDPRNEVTLSRSATPAVGGSLSLTLSSDGTLSRTEVGVADGEGLVTTISEHGLANAAGTGFDTAAATRSTEIADTDGHFISRVTIDVASDETIDFEEIIEHDSEDRPTVIGYFDGSVETRTYSTCCGQLETSTRNGVTTAYTYDDLGRQDSVTQGGITTLTTYDAAGRVRKTTRQPEGNPAAAIVTAETTYDPAGRLVATEDAEGRVTTYEETVSSLTGHTTSITRLPYDTGWPVEDRPVQVSVTDATGRPVSQSGTASRPVRYEYGAATLPDADLWGYATTDLFAYTRTIALDAAGQDTPEIVTTYTSPAGRTLKVLYADDAAARSFYDSVGRLVRQVDPDGVQTLREQSPLGDVTITAVDMDRDGVIGYAGGDRITRTTTTYASREDLPVRRTTTEVWATNDVDAPTTVSVSETSLDGLQSWQTSRGQTTYSQTVIATNGTRTDTTTLPDGSSQVRVVSAIGRLVSVVQKDSANVVLSEVRYDAPDAYDAHGRLQNQTQTGVGTTTTTYYDDDRVHTVTTPDPDPARSGIGYDPQTTTYTYDAAGRLSDVTLPDGTHTYTSYYPTGQTKRTWGSLTYPQEYTYDTQGRVKTLTTWQDFAGDTGKAVTTWNYDSQRGWLESKFYPDPETGLSDNTSAVDYTYTDAGRLETRTWARTENGQEIVTTYSYFNDGQLAGMTYTDPSPEPTPNVSMTYKRWGARATMTDITGERTYTYRDDLQPDQELLPAYYGDRILTRTYQVAASTSEPTSVPGRPSGFTLGTTGNLSSDYAVSYGYDTAGRLKTVTSPHGAHSYTYTLNRPQLLETHTSPVHTATRTYDPGRTNVAKIENKVGSTLVSGYTYTLNDANQREERAQTGTAFTTASTDVFGYNAKGELTESSNTQIPAYDRDFSYDDIGNRLTSVTTSGTTGYTANALNQYSEVSAPFVSSVANPSYDLDGNQTATGTGQLYTWDGENRLVGVEPVSPATGDKKVVNVYDGQSRRVRREVSTYNGSSWDVTSDEKFIYDGWNLIAKYDAQVSGLSLQISYTWGLDLSGSMQGAGGVGGLLSVQEHAGTHQGVYHFTYDANGNVSEVLDSTGVAAAHYEYDPFGNTVASSGAYADANTYRFSTKPLDDVASLYYYGFRYYRPAIGRWLNRDPMEELAGANIYTFILNKVACKYDILGLSDDEGTNLWKAQCLKFRAHYLEQRKLINDEYYPGLMNARLDLLKINAALGEKEWNSDNGINLKLMSSTLDALALMGKAIGNGNSKEAKALEFFGGAATASTLVNDFLETSDAKTRLALLGDAAIDLVKKRLYESMYKTIAKRLGMSVAKLESAVGVVLLAKDAGDIATEIYNFKANLQSRPQGYIQQYEFALADAAKNMYRDEQLWNCRECDQFYGRIDEGK